jgi:two-component system, NarL family, response regulator DegU
VASDQLHRDALRIGVEGLSTRELEVLRLVSNGSTNSEIGDDLGLSVHAVKFHLASIYRKLGVANRTEAAVAFVGASSPQVVATRAESE